LLSSGNSDAGTAPRTTFAEPIVIIAAVGVLIPEALAAGRLDTAGIPADVVCVISPGLLFKALLARQGWADAPTWILNQAFPDSRATPLVTVLDGHPPTLASSPRSARSRASPSASPGSASRARSQTSTFTTAPTASCAPLLT
jgi:hypothetical protein